MNRYMIWQALSALSLVILAVLPSTSHSGSLGLRCQFIPYTHCLYEFSAQLNIEKVDELIDGLFIGYSGENISLHPGLFSHTIKINGTPLEDDVFLRVRNGQVTFNRRYNQAFIEAINQTLPGKVNLEIKSQRIPLLIDDRKNNVGWMHLKLMRYVSLVNKESKVLSTSSIRMKPTNGCWLDEHACVNYPD